MSKTMFAAKLASSTRKAKRMTTKKSTEIAVNKRKPRTATVKSTKLTASTRKAEKVISKTVPNKSTSSNELVHPKDLLSPTDLELFWKRKNLVRIWPD